MKSLVHDHDEFVFGEQVRRCFGTEVVDNGLLHGGDQTMLGVLKEKEVCDGLFRLQRMEVAFEGGEVHVVAVQGLVKELFKIARADPSSMLGAGKAIGGETPLAESGVPKQSDGGAVDVLANMVVVPLFLKVCAVLRAVLHDGGPCLSDHGIGFGVDDDAVVFRVFLTHDEQVVRGVRALLVRARQRRNGMITQKPVHIYL